LRNSKGRPNESMQLAVLGLVLAAWLGLAEAAERAKAEIKCAPAGPILTYDCMIRLTRAATGKPLTGVELSVGADMPSMPMAHNVRPVKAVPGKGPGEYTVRLELEMYGDWAVRLRLSGPVREQLFTHFNFVETQVTPTEPPRRKQERRP
jgi:YtkA-like protein